MTVLASECQGISGSIDTGFLLLNVGLVAAIFFLHGFFWGEGPFILYSVLRAVGRFLRPLFRALRWLFDRFNLGVAWFLVCNAVCLSFVTFLVAWNGSPVPALHCWPVPVLCFGAWGFEQFYLWECKLDANYQAFQRGEL